MGDLSRRGFLKGASILGCSVAASPLVTPITLAAAPGENRLVVIILRGAMDGLDVVRPLGDPKLSALRPTLAGKAREDSLDLDGFYGMHPALKPLEGLWRDGHLGFAQAVSTPYRDKRSHFDGQDMLEAGTGMDVPLSSVRDGWLNRLLQDMPGAGSETAFAVGREEMKIVSGRAPVSSWSPDARLDLSPQARLLLDQIYHEDALFRDTSVEAIEIAESLGVASGDSFGLSKTEMRELIKAQQQAGQAAVLAEFAGRRLAEEARIAAFSIGGWDTHRGQARGIGRALDGLSSAILTLKRHLGPHWDRTAIVALTEFGRTARENGTRGTDHGTAGALVMAGGAIRGGRVLGNWPGLDEAALYARRDLMPTADVRAYPAWLMAGLFGTDPAVLQSRVFPGLDLARDPGILA